jgi:hypothetical protein
MFNTFLIVSSLRPEETLTYAILHPRNHTWQDNRITTTHAMMLHGKDNRALNSRAGLNTSPALTHTS